MTVDSYSTSRCGCSDLRAEQIGLRKPSNAQLQDDLKERAAGLLTTNCVLTRFPMMGKQICLSTHST